MENQKGKELCIQRTGEEERYSNNTLGDNVISSELMEYRVSNIFNRCRGQLVQSYGVNGGLTMIVTSGGQYYSTKDGYTIMKSIRQTDNRLDRAIAAMIFNACSAMNNKVGDGTSTAIIAATSVYIAYKHLQDKFKNTRVAPGDLIRMLKKLSKRIEEKIVSKRTLISDLPKEEMLKIIRDIVHISDNGDDTITNAICDIYQEIGIPSINLKLGNIGSETHYKIVEGFEANVCIADPIYINTDDKVMVENNVDVIMFDHKITRRHYLTILKPLAEACRIRGRRLFVIAPGYDQKTVDTLIRKDIMEEFDRRKTISLIIGCAAFNDESDYTAMLDLAMLLNTSLISQFQLDEVFKLLDTNQARIFDICDIDRRGIPGINIAVIDSSKTRFDEKTGMPIEPIHFTTAPSDSIANYGKADGDYNDGKQSIIDEENCRISPYRIGFCKEITIDLKKGTFSGFYFNQDLFDKHMLDARNKYDEAMEQYGNLGGYCGPIIAAENRLLRLSLKVGIIYIGGDTELMQDYINSTALDAVKAAQSAYENGYINGCSMTTIKAIKEVQEEHVQAGSNAMMSSYQKLKYDAEGLLIEVLLEGFIDVVRQIFGPGIEQREVKDNFKDNDAIVKYIWEKEFINISEKDKGIEVVKTTNGDIDILDTIIYTMIKNDCTPIDLRNSRTYSSSVINSTRTDTEILKATCELIGILIGGKQLIIKD